MHHWGGCTKFAMMPYTPQEACGAEHGRAVGVTKLDNEMMASLVIKQESKAGWGTEGGGLAVWVV